MRLVFMGSPAFAVDALDALIKAGHEVIAVYSQPPRRAGRGKEMRPTPVHAYADSHGFEIRTPDNFKAEETRTAFLALDADAAIVVAYGLILPKAILEAPKWGCLNIHPSLLPRWRGAAPIQRAIMAGDDKTGISIMRMDEGLDTGAVCTMAECAITDTTTAGHLHDELAQMGAKLIIETLRQLQAGQLTSTPQPETGITYAEKISKLEARIDFKRSAGGLLRHIHGLSPFPGAWCQLDHGGSDMRLKLLQVVRCNGSGKPGEIIDDNFTIACGEGALRPVTLQRQGKAPLPLAAFLRGVTALTGSYCR